MKINDFKSVISDFLVKMINQWFEDKPFMKGIGISLIKANTNKYDNLIKLFEDENGNIDAIGMIKNMGLEDGIKIDLQKLSPILPNRIVLITKEDINELCQQISFSQ